MPYPNLETMDFGFLVYIDVGTKRLSKMFHYCNHPSCDRKPDAFEKAIKLCDKLCKYPLIKIKDKWYFDKRDIPRHIEFIPWDNN